MKGIEFKLMFYSNELEALFKFYSCVGMIWDNPDLKFGESGWPVDWESCPELQSVPPLWGTLGAVEIFVFWSPAAVKEISSNNSILMIYCDNDDSIRSVLVNLDKIGLLRKHAEFDLDTRRLIYDPDGRIVELVLPHPFRV